MPGDTLPHDAAQRLLCELSSQRGADERQTNEVKSVIVEIFSPTFGLLACFKAFSQAFKGPDLGLGSLGLCLRVL